MHFCFKFMPCCFSFRENSWYFLVDMSNPGNVFFVIAFDNFNNLFLLSCQFLFKFIYVGIRLRNKFFRESEINSLQSLYLSVVYLDSLSKFRQNLQLSSTHLATTSTFWLFQCSLLRCLEYLDLLLQCLNIRTTLLTHFSQLIHRLIKFGLLILQHLEHLLLHLTNLLMQLLYGRLTDPNSSTFLSAFPLGRLRRAQSVPNILLAFALALSVLVFGAGGLQFWLEALGHFFLLVDSVENLKHLFLVGLKIKLILKIINIDFLFQTVSELILHSRDLRFNGCLNILNLLLDLAKLLLMNLLIDLPAHLLCQLRLQYTILQAIFDLGIGVNLGSLQPIEVVIFYHFSLNFELLFSHEVLLDW